MLRIGQFGPPVDISDERAKEVVNKWRQQNYMIVQGWKETHSLLSSAFVGRQAIEHKHGIVYEGKGTVGFIHHKPTGLSMRYDGVEVDERGKLSYVNEAKFRKDGGVTLLRSKLYGGIETENRTQFLGRLTVGANAIDIARTQARKKVRIANTTHDELLLVVPVRHADRVLRDVKEIMTTPPTWAEGVPFGVDAHISERYDK